MLSFDGSMGEREPVPRRFTVWIVRQFPGLEIIALELLEIKDHRLEKLDFLGQYKSDGGQFIYAIQIVANKFDRLVAYPGLKSSTFLFGVMGQLEEFQRVEY